MKNYLRTLAQAEGIEDPSDDDLRRIDRGRKDKKVSNETWEKPGGWGCPDRPDEGRTTHLAYKAEHAVDLETEAIVNAQVSTATRGDGEKRHGECDSGAGGAEPLRKRGRVQGAGGGQGLPRQRASERMRPLGSGPTSRNANKPKRVWRNKPAEAEVTLPGNRRRVREIEDGV